MRESLQETYPEAWREFWKWRTLHWISWAVWIPAILLSVWTSLDIRSWLCLSLMLLLGCFLSLTCGGLRGFSCPRWPKRFLVGPAVGPVLLPRWWFHCGLWRCAAGWGEHPGL